MYRVVFYCPDKHIKYDGNTPYRTGVGGGITARVRMAKALSKAGHEVVMVVNCPRRERINGVEYLPLGNVRKIEGDVLIANTSGGAMDLRPVLDLETNVRLQLVWAHGTIKPTGLEEVGYDYLYAVSNFVADVAHLDWGIPHERIFVVYNAYEEELFSQAERKNPIRDPFRLVYFTHPSKGLDTAVAVLKRLRAANPDFHLFVFGGPGLWGQEETEPQQEEGLCYKGLIGQRELAFELLQCSYSLQLQEREEPGALAIVDAMRAGCIIVGSPVGCYPEMVEHGRAGLLIPGDHWTNTTRDQAATTILGLMEDQVAGESLRRKAQAVIWECDTMARVWTGHWDWRFSDEKGEAASNGAYDAQSCSSCGGRRLLLEDGYHCVGCGWYERDHGAHS